MTGTGNATNTGATSGNRSGRGHSFAQVHRTRIKFLRRTNDSFFPDIKCVPSLFFHGSLLNTHCPVAVDSSGTRMSRTSSRPGGTGNERQYFKYRRMM